VLVLAFIGFGSRYLNFNNRFLGYANEAVLPFYIFHQTLIIVIGYFIIQLDLGVFPKYAIIVLTSFSAIMLLYDLGVRRCNFMRLLFGMRRKKPKTG